MEATAYWALVQQHLPTLKEHARKITYYVLRNSRPGSIYTADDLLHDTLLKVGKSTTSRASQPEPDWFIKVCKVAMRNIAYDLLSTVDSKRTRTIVGAATCGAASNGYRDDQQSAQDELLSNTTLSPLELLVKQDEDHALEEALDQLHRKSPNQAIVLLYSLDVEDHYSASGNCHAAKAQELGISHTSYRQSIYQATKRLKQSLNP